MSYQKVLQRYYPLKGRKNGNPVIFIGQTDSLQLQGREWAIHWLVLFFVILVEVFKGSWGAA
jgi:hypothetical protein